MTTRTRTWLEEQLRPAYPYPSEQDRMAERRADLCIQCDIQMQPASSGKKQCRKCGALLTCCDNP